MLIAPDKHVHHDTVRGRISARITALDVSPITIAKSIKLERGYINDFLIGKKKSLKAAKLSAIAGALECDVEYLTGQQEVVRKSS